MKPAPFRGAGDRAERRRGGGRGGAFQPAAAPERRRKTFSLAARGARPGPRLQSRRPGAAASPRATERDPMAPMPRPRAGLRVPGRRECSLGVVVRVTSVTKGASATFRALGVPPRRAPRPPRALPRASGGESWRVRPPGAGTGARGRAARARWGAPRSLALQPGRPRVAHPVRLSVRPLRVPPAPPLTTRRSPLSLAAILRPILQTPPKQTRWRRSWAASSTT